jgi:hypothetical protein
MIKFRQKGFSHYFLNDAVKGAAIGGFIGGGSTGYINGALPAIPTFKQGAQGGKQRWNEFAKILNKDPRNSKKEQQRKRLVGTTAGMIIGAALGALVGGVKDITEKINQKNNLCGKVTDDVVKILKRNGKEEDVDFTLNPKVADKIRTKVCFVLTRDGDGLRLLINLKNDNNLAKATTKITKQLGPGVTTKRQTASDRYNEILIMTSNGFKSDTRLITNLIEDFIEEGYPVYIVEVG